MGFIGYPRNYQLLEKDCYPWNEFVKAGEGKMKQRKHNIETKTYKKLYFMFIL